MLEFSDIYGINVSKSKNNRHVESENHSHPYYELLYVRSGNFTYFIDDEIIPVEPKTIILTNRNTIHKARLYEEGDSTYFVIRFYPTSLDDALSDTLLNLFKFRRFSVDEKDFSLIDLLFSKIYKEFKNKSDGCDIMLKYELSEILITLSRLVSKSNLNIENEHTPTVIEESIKYINSLVGTPEINEITLTSVAEKFFMSPTHFSRKFKQETGFGFKEYIISAKILFAKNLMHSTNYSITKIALMSGFDDSNYFSTVFKNHESISPRAYINFSRKISDEQN
ncbi:MAG: AraC family transcriptional regulator [Clostridia bacterium]|nr:AraC family transcriptional regulator [Clostridia bacterium]